MQTEIHIQKFQGRRIYHWHKLWRSFLL